MNTSHKYKYKINLNTESSATKVIRFVGDNKRVLEIGAGPGSLTEVLKNNNNCSISAIEIDETAIPFLSPLCEAVYPINLNDQNWITHFDNKQKYDVVIAGDVLEHLYEPLATLTNIKHLLNENGYIVVSLPHAAHNSIIACLLNNDFAYQNSGLLDKTHIRFFAIKNIQTFFRDAGLKIIHAEFVVRDPKYTELSKYWLNLPSTVKYLLSKHKFGSVYQVVLKAKEVSSAEPEVILEDIEVPSIESTYPTNSSLKDRVFFHAKRIILPYLSEKHRAILKRILMKLNIKY